MASYTLCLSEHATRMLKCTRTHTHTHAHSDTDTRARTQTHRHTHTHTHTQELESFMHDCFAIELTGECLKCFHSTDARRACRRGAIGSTMGAYPRDTGSNPVEDNGDFFPSCRQLYLSSFFDTDTHRCTDRQTHMHTHAHTHVYTHAHRHTHTHTDTPTFVVACCHGYCTSQCSDLAQLAPTSKGLSLNP